MKALFEQTDLIQRILNLLKRTLRRRHDVKSLRIYRPDRL